MLKMLKFNRGGVVLNFAILCFPLVIVAQSQEGPKSFESLEVNEEKLPDYRADKTIDVGELPARLESIPSLDDKRKPDSEWFRVLRGNTAVLIVVEKRDRILFRSPRINYGHAIRVEPEFIDTPVWITSRHWLEPGNEICLLYDDSLLNELGMQQNSDALPRLADRVSREQQWEWLKSNKDKCIDVQIEERDRKTNLAILRPQRKHPNPAPKGLSTEPRQSDSSAAKPLYAFSYYVSDHFIQLDSPPRRASRRHLQFYWRLSMRVSPGTPIMNHRGDLLAMAAFPAPGSPSETLFNPVDAIELGLEKMLKRSKSSE